MLEVGDEQEIECGVPPLSVLEETHAMQLRAALRHALKVAHSAHPGGSVVYAAKMLKISRSRLSRLMRKHKLRRDGSSA